MNIRSTATLIFCALALHAAVYAADLTEPKLSVETIGVRVAKPNPLKERLLWPAGTTVSLLVTSPLNELIHFDATDSTVAKFVDDKGTDLQARLKDSTEPAPLGAFGSAPKIDKDSKNCIVEINASGLPVKGAAQLRLQGTLAMWCATQKKETIVENVAIRNGTKIAGPNNLELEIIEINEGKRDLARDVMTFVLRAQKELDNVAEIKFFIPNGAEVKAVRTSSSTLSVQGQVKADWSYSFSERADTLTVKILTWSDMQKKRVKFDLTVDLGL